MPSIDDTMMFKREKKTKQLSKEEVIEVVVKSLREKKYDVSNQLTGYLLSGDPTYITNHNDARTVVTTYEREELLEMIVDYYLDRN